MTCLALIVRAVFRNSIIWKLEIFESRHVHVWPMAVLEPLFYFSFYLVKLFLPSLFGHALAIRFGQHSQLTSTYHYNYVHCWLVNMLVSLSRLVLRRVKKIPAEWNWLLYCGCQNFMSCPLVPSQICCALFLGSHLEWKRVVREAKDEVHAWAGLYPGPTAYCYGDHLAWKWGTV